MNENSEKNICGNPDSQNRNITEWNTGRNGSPANGSTYVFTYDLLSRLKSS